MELFSKKKLVDYYIVKKLSVAAIARKLGCSENKINYWFKKYAIPKRSISDAVYLKANPSGDPFTIKKPRTINEAILYGLGIGLYWGEGTKSNKHSVRLGNTDPMLVGKFIEFLEDIYSIKRSRLKFGLQIFSDMPPEEALKFWVSRLRVSRKQFQKIIVTPARSIGTYRHKTKHGVLTVYFNNKKLRDILCGVIDKI